MKRLFKALILMGILFPVEVFALGLGELETQSALNQPFRAEMKILRASQSDLKSLKANLASAKDYARIGLERLPILNALNFKVVKKGNAHYIRITSKRRISEPYLNFLIEVNWSRGRILREFTVLLDPPELLGSGAPELTAPKAQAPKEQAAERREKEDTRKAREAVSTGTTEAGIVYGPVQRNEQLWNIAKHIKAKEQDATIEQITMALLRNNPDAFIRENVNNLKRGHVLRIENPQNIYEMDARTASVAFRRQYQLWQDYKQRRADAARAKAKTRRQSRDQKTSQSREKVTEDSTEGVLTLERPPSKKPVAGHLESSRPGSGEQNEQISKLRKELAASEESEELSKKRNEEMHERLKAMEDQIASLQRLMQVKSDELVALQETEKEALELATEPQNDEDAVITPQTPSVIDELQKNPQLMGLVGGTGLLLLTMLWVIVRKRRAMAENDYRFDSRVSDHSDIYEEPDYGVSAPRSIEEDPLTQADIFVAYGNLDAAINLMSSAAERNPENSEYQRKLDELAAMLVKRDGTLPDTETLADTLIPEQQFLEEESLLTSEDLAAFQQELESAEQETFSNIDPFETKSVVHDDTDSSEVQQFEDTSALLSGPIDNSIDFDLGDLDEELQQLTSNEELESPSDNSMLDFDLDEINEVSELLVEDDSKEQGMPLIDDGLELEENLSSTAETLDSKLEQGLNTVDESLELELEESLGLVDGALDHGPEESLSPVDETLGDAFEESMSAVEKYLDQELEEGLGPVDGALDQELDEITLDTELPDLDDDGLIEIGDHEPDLFNSVDEVGTKLDLARAYIDMGDPDGARSILDEVLTEGNENQIAQAHELLEQI